MENKDRITPQTKLKTGWAFTLVDNHQMHTKRRLVSAFESVIPDDQI